jgi:hypothetical protein
MELPEKYEQIQHNKTSRSRGTRMGQRVTRNVEEFVEVAKRLQVPIDNVLCVGAGDGWEVQEFMRFGYTSIGVEVAEERCKVAKEHNIDVIYGVVEELSSLFPPKKWNVYCAHTLEHCFNRDLAIEQMMKVTKDWIYIVAPIEPRGSPNKAHYSPIRDLQGIKDAFSKGWVKIREVHRFNLEPEGSLLFRRVDPP